MKILITLNLVTAILLCAVMIAFQRFENVILLLFGMVLLPSFYTLALGNLIAIFFFWKKHRVRSILPALSYLLAATLLVVGTSAGFHAVLRGTPCAPDSFLNDKTRQDLAAVAHSLLGCSIKEICTYPGKPLEVEMVSKRKGQLSPGIEETLRTYTFQRTHVDDALTLVVFCHYHHRKWHEYLYTTNDFPPLYSRPVTFTESDIEDWAELLEIARQGATATDDESKRIVFSPSIVYPYFQQKLGDDVLTQLRQCTSSNQIPPEYKALVLDALNQQRQLASRLVEDPSITFDDGMFTLHLGDKKIRAGFWVTPLVKQLLDRGVLLDTDDGRHLKIKADASPEEILNIEWVHIGLMNFLYGNLVQKREYAYIRSLGDGWYYNRW